MDRLHKKELKTDAFAAEAVHTVEFLSTHGKQVKLYGGIALAVLVLGVGYYVYSGYQQTARMEALGAALKIDDATVGQNAQPPLLNFPTEEEKTKARTAAFADVAAKFRGSQEGAIAQMYLAALQTDQGKLVEAEKIYKDVADSAPAAFASVATVALADLQIAQGKHADAEKTLKALVDSPTVFVSKDEATIHLAEAISKTRPQDARKMLEPLRTARSTVSRAAIEVLGRLPEAK